MLGDLRSDYDVRWTCFFFFRFWMPIAHVCLAVKPNSHSMHFTCTYTRMWILDLEGLSRLFDHAHSDVPGTFSMAAFSTKTLGWEAVPPTFGRSPAAESTTQTVHTVTLLPFLWRWVWPPFSWTLIGIGRKSFPQTTSLSRILNDFLPTAVHF